MDQSFSLRNLRRIWDSQTRRGKELLPMFPDVRAAYDVARDAVREARAVSRGTVRYIGPAESEPAAIANAKRQAAEAALMNALAKTSDSLIDRVEEGSFEWGLREAKLLGARQLYEISDTPEAFFADRQLQASIKAVLPARPGDRQSIISGLARSLDNDLPKVVLRTDVASFFESIDHAKLRGRIACTRLSPTSKQLINLLLVEMERLVGAPKGLPTGVGLSAKLAELYITEVDTAIRRRPEVLFYARYVDDIVIVTADTSRHATVEADLASLVTKQLNLLDLKLNSKKHETSRLSEAKMLRRFEFLGYTLSYAGTSRLKVTLTKERIATLRNRVCRTFDAWDRAEPDNHGRRSLLLDRLRLLTGNTRLANNKRNAMVGIYFSNPHVTDGAIFSGLDSFLQHRAMKSYLPDGLKEHIDRLSFVEGFNDRQVYRFTPQRIEQLTKVWREKA